MKSSELKNQEYKYGFSTDIENFKVPKGLKEETIRLISKIKKDSEISKWLIDFSKEKIYQGKDFMIDLELKRMTKNLFNEDFKSLEDKLPRKNFS